MKTPDTRNSGLSRTLRALSRLLDYPDRALRLQMPELRRVLREGSCLDDARLESLDVLIDRLGGADDFAPEIAYVELFDRGRQTSLHLFEHVHGDSRDRGPAMIDLIQTYEAAGLLLGPHELPDHLGVVLEFASTQTDEGATAFLGELVHLLRTLTAVLQRQHSDYASIIAALLALAGESCDEELPLAPPPPDLSIDETWQEPEAFGGCSVSGQTRGPAIQPVHLVRRPAASRAQGARS